MNYSLALIALAAGCGGGGSALEGMYMIDGWNENPTSCADPGPSVLGDPSHGETVFYVKTENFLGEFLNARGCVDLAECQTMAADDTVHVGMFATFDDGNDDDGWSSRFAAGLPEFDDPTMCAGTLLVDTLTPDGESGITLRLETAEFLYPKNAGDCSDLDEAEAASVGVACMRVEVVHGTQIGDI